MGYDMRWVRRPDGEKEALEAARKAFHAACSERDELPKQERGVWSPEEMAADAHHRWDVLPANASDRYREAQEKVRRLSREMDEIHRSYFRLNIWGMGNVRDAMLALGVAYGDYSEADRPEYPSDIPDGYYDWDDDPASVGELDGVTLTLYRDIAARVNAYLTWSPRTPESGIPIHKFGSNDGWLVLPEECFVAASMIRAADPDVVTKALAEARITGPDWAEVWGRWVQWLADASEYGGFAVH